MAIVFAIFYFLISLVLVIAVVLISPLFLFRYIVSLICPLIRPDLVEIVNPRSAVHAVDDLHTDPKNTELLYIVLEGPVNINNFRDSLTNRIDKYCLNKLKQYFVKWLGYHFWKRDPEFDIKNHVHYYVGKNGNIDDLITEKEIHSQHSRFLTEPFPEFRSPWKFIIVRNYQPKDAEAGKQYSLCIFWIHHSIADGYGLMSAFLDMELMDLAKEKKLTKQNSKSNNILNTFYELAFLLKAPYRLVKYYCECMDKESPFIMGDRSGDYHTGFTKLSLPSINKIKDKYAATFTSVYLAAISAGIRSFLLDNNLPIPPLIHVLFPLPLPGAYKPLTNRITFVLVKLPIGMADSESRLQFLIEQFTQLKNSPFPLILSWLPLIAGSMPSFLIRPMITVKYTSAVTSNFPGPSKQTNIFEYPLVDWSVSGNLMGGYSGMAFANISYKQSSTVILIGDRSVFPQETAIEAIMKNMNSELEYLSI